MYIIEVLSFKDSSRNPNKHSKSFLANDLNGAIHLAAFEIMKYLSLYHYHHATEEPEPILSGDPLQIWEWYLRNEHLFVGNFVPTLFEVSIKRSPQKIDKIDIQHWQQLCENARDFLQGI